MRWQKIQSQKGNLIQICSIFESNHILALQVQNHERSFSHSNFRYKEYLGFTPHTAFLCQRAALSKEVLEYLAGFDILVHETYGQSETSGLLCANIPKRYCKLGTSGKVKILFEMI